MKENAKKAFGKKHLLAVLIAVMVFACVFAVSALADVTPAITDASLTVGESVSVNFLVTAPADANPTMKFTYKDIETVVEPTSQSDTSYVFTFEGITPQNFEEKVTGTLVVDSAEIATKAISVEDYCEWALTQDSLENIATALLNYGAAAEWYVGEVTEAPAINGLPTKDQMSVVAEKGLDAADGTETATLKRAGLILTNIISTYFDFETSVTNPSMAVTVDGVAREAKITNNGDGTYRAVIAMKATEIFGKIEATVTDESGNEISRTATYSVTAYLNKQADYAEDDGQLAMLVKAIYRYGYYAHDLDTHELMPLSKDGDTTVKLVCTLCNEVYTLSDLAYVEDYAGGTGAVVPGNTGENTVLNYTGKLENVNGTLYVVNNGASNSDMQFMTKNYQKDNSLLFGIDLKLPTEERVTDWGIFMKPNGKWGFQPTNPLYVAKDGTVKMLGNTVDITLSSETFTSFLFNLTLTTSGSAETSDSKVTYTLDAWVNGVYFGSFEETKDAKDGSTYYDASLADAASAIQFSLRFIKGTSEDGSDNTPGNAMYYDNVILANGLTNVAGKNVDEIATLVHDHALVNTDAATCTTTGTKYYTCNACGDSYEETVAALGHSYNRTVTTAATCYARGAATDVCSACGDSQNVVLPTEPHANLSLNVVDGALVATCAVCSENITGTAEWASETLRLSDGATNNISNMPTAANGVYAYTGSGSQWQPQYRVDEGAKVDARRGVFSIDIMGAPGADWSFQLYNRHDNGGGWASETTYAAGTSHGMHFLTIDANGNVKLTSTDAKGSPVIGDTIGAVTSSAYTTITVIFKKNVEADTIILDYYVNNTYVASQELYSFIYNDTPYGFYSSCNVPNGTTVTVDNVYFAYTDTEREEFIQHTHTYEETVITAATCFEEGEMSMKCSDCGDAKDSVVIPKLTHALIAAGMDADTHVHTGTMSFACSRCNEVFGLAVNYAEDYSDSSCIGVAPGTYDTTNTKVQNGALYMVASTKNNADKQYTLKNYVNNGNGMLFGIDLKQPTEGTRDNDFMLLLKPNGAWTNEPEKPIKVDKNGNVYVAGTDTGVDLSTTEFTSFLLNMTITPNDTKTATTYAYDLWVNGAYHASYSQTVTHGSGAVAEYSVANGTILQVSVRTALSYNAMWYDNLIITNPLTVEDTALSSYMTSVLHNLGEADVDPASCTKTGSSTATCTVCGEKVTETLEKLPHTLTFKGLDAVTHTHTGNIVYTCSTCNEGYGINAAYFEDYSDATCTGGIYTFAEAAKVEVVDGALKVYKSNTNNNAQVSLTPNKASTTGTTEMMFGFDLKDVATRSTIFTLQAKISGTWNSTPTRITIGTDDIIKFAGADTGYQLSDTEFTNFILKYTLVENTSNTTLYVDLWINGEYVARGSEELAATGMTWQNGNSYPQLCLASTGSTADDDNAIIYDNIFIADVPADADGTDFGSYLTLVHNYETTTQAPTCTEAGSVTKAGLGCGASTSETLPATGHSYSVTGSVAPTSCAVPGADTYTCANCDDTYEKAVYAAHNTLATSLVDGAVTVSCSDCSGTWTATSSYYETGDAKSGMSDSHNGGWTKDETVTDAYVASNTGTSGQYQIYLNNSASLKTEAENRRGVFSIKIKASLAGTLDFKFCNAAQGSWSLQADGTMKGISFMSIASGGSVSTKGTTSKSIATVGADEYVTLTVVFEKDTLADKLNLDYYVDNTLMASSTIDNYMYADTPVYIYVSGSMTNSSITVDDFMFGFTDDARDDLLVGAN